MNHSDKICPLVQESIAWGRDLSNEEQEHVIHCADCNEVALQFTALDSLVEQAVDIDVPVNFANRVMARIKGAPELHSYEERAWVPEWVERVYEFRPLQFAAAGIAVFLGFVNLSQILASLLAAG